VLVSNSFRTLCHEVLKSVHAKSGVFEVEKPIQGSYTGGYRGVRQSLLFEDYSCYFSKYL